MYKLRFLIAKCLIAVILSTSSSEAIQFDCSFQVRIPSTRVGQRYACQPTVIYSGLTSLETVTGVHLAGKSNNDVEFLYIYRQNLTFVPEGIADFFRNLDVLFIYYSSLTSISANDLRPFPRLVYLRLDLNQLTSIDGDLFKYTPHLQYVSFDVNQIQHIGHDLVTSLNNLIELWLQNNDCINQYAQTRAAVLSLAPQLSVLCPPLEVTTTTTPASTTTETKFSSDIETPNTTPASTIRAVTTVAGTGYNSFCSSKAIKTARRFPIGTGCKQYVYCYFFKSDVKGQLYTCAGTTMFNATTLECVPAFKCTT